MSTPLGWQTQVIKKQFVGEICGSCGKIIFPPRDICPECGEPTLPEGVNLNAALREGKKPPRIICYSPVTKERGG